MRIPYILYFALVWTKNVSLEELRLTVAPKELFGGLRKFNAADSVPPKGMRWADFCKLNLQQSIKPFEEPTIPETDGQLTWRNRSTETVLFSNRTAAARAIKFARRVIAGDGGLAEMQEVLERCRCEGRV